MFLQTVYEVGLAKIIVKHRNLSKYIVGASGSQIFFRILLARLLVRRELGNVHFPNVSRVRETRGKKRLLFTHYSYKIDCIPP